MPDAATRARVANNGMAPVNNLVTPDKLTTYVAPVAPVVPQPYIDPGLPQGVPGMGSNTTPPTTGINPMYLYGGIGLGILIVIYIMNK